MPRTATPKAKAAGDTKAEPMPRVLLYTDGACSGNPGPGGWAYVLKHPATGKVREAACGEPRTTNNRMELTAAIRALQAALADHPNVGEIRGEGMLCAVELVADRAARRHFDPGQAMGAKVVAAMLKRGVIARAMPQGDILGFAPPLCLTREEADTIVSVTRDSIVEILGNG